jgi:hypothetical protein
MRKGIGPRGDIFEPSATLFLALDAGKLYSRLASVFLELWALDFSCCPMYPSFEESPGR